MSVINSFQEYCSAFHSEKAIIKGHAEMIRYLRDWMIHLQALDEGKEEEKRGYVSNYELFADNWEPEANGKQMDELSRIAKNSWDACRHIAENFRSKILRENVLMPSYQAREIGSTGLRWLSFRPGRTIREKLSYTNNKLCAVRRRFSLDTGENRLFMAFLRRMEELVEMKAENATIVERRLGDWAHKLLHEEDLSEIGRWENTAPNNTLLSDKYYRAVWHAWKDLEKLDGMIAADDENLSVLMCTAFYWKLICSLSRYCRFCTQPVLYDYTHFSVFPWLDKDQNDYSHTVGFLTDKDIVLDLDRNASKISIQYQSNNLVLIFTNEQITFLVNGQEISREPVSASVFQNLVKITVSALFTEKELLKQDELFSGVDTGSVYIDAFSVRPNYLLENGKCGSLPRTLWQIFGKEHGLAADESKALYISSAKEKLYSIRSCLFEGADGKILLNLFRIIRRRINSRNLAMPLPDVYSVFQVAPLLQAAHMCYENVSFAPKSISVLIYALTHNYLEKISSGDCVLVADYTQETLALTLLQGKYVEDIHKALPKSQGFVWERHPVVTVKHVIKNETVLPQEILDVFGREDLANEKNELAFDLALDQLRPWVMIDDSMSKQLQEAAYNIESEIDTFKKNYSNIVSGHKLFILLASPWIFLGKKKSNRILSAATLFGLRTLMDWEQILLKYSERNNIELPHLWSEHLPSLSIKRIYGAFPLIGKDNRKEPLLGKAQQIPISSAFVLPKNQSEYHFGLLMGTDKEISYEAVLRHRAFPLPEDVVCELQLTYTYGQDNPYELIFIPEDKQEAVFSFVKVSWERAGEFSYHNQLYPQFPLSSKTWAQLEHGETYSKRKGKMTESNYLEWVDSWSQKVFELKRYIIMIGEDDWFPTRSGSWMCIKKGLHIEGKVIDIAFFPNQFSFPDSFDIKDMKVSFSVRSNKDGKYSAADIVVEENGTKSIFSATDVVQDNSQYNRHNIKAHVFFPLHHIYANGMTSHTPGCPNYFLNTVQKLRDKIPAAFDEAAEKKDYNSMRVFFRIMCIMAKDFGNSAYGRILNVLMDYPQIIDEDCGCALGDYDLSEENQVLNAILGSKLSEEVIIGILGKAAWKSDGFIKNMRPEILLKYYDCAVDYLAGRSKKNGLQEKSVLWCLEYILAVFRLREKKIDSIDWRLSLNDEYTKKLADTIEDYIKAGVVLPYSRVKMELRNTSEEYSNIPTLMYAILVYINGGEDEIIITEISEDIDD